MLSRSFSTRAGAGMQSKGKLEPWVRTIFASVTCASAAGKRRIHPDSGASFNVRVPPTPDRQPPAFIHDIRAPDLSHLFGPTLLHCTFTPMSRSMAIPIYTPTTAASASMSGASGTISGLGFPLVIAQRIRYERFRQFYFTYINMLWDNAEGSHEGRDAAQTDRCNLWFLFEGMYSRGLDVEHFRGITRTGPGYGVTTRGWKGFRRYVAVYLEWFCEIWPIDGRTVHIEAVLSEVYRDSDRVIV